VNSGLVCLSLGGIEPAAVVEVANRHRGLADVVELRLDLLPGIDLAGCLSGIRLPALCTDRFSPAL